MKKAVSKIALGEKKIRDNNCWWAFTWCSIPLLAIWSCMLFRMKSMSFKELTRSSESGPLKWPATRQNFYRFSEFHKIHMIHIHKFIFLVFHRKKKKTQNIRKSKQTKLRFINFCIVTGEFHLYECTLTLPDIYL